MSVSYFKVLIPASLDEPNSTRTQKPMPMNPAIPARFARSTLNLPWSTTPLHLLPSTPLSHPSLRPYSTKRPKKAPAPPPPAGESPPTPDLPTASDPTLPHLTPSQTVHMTSISHKAETTRIATAMCRVTFSNPSAYALLTTNEGLTKKGDVLSVARIAGIMAAKRTADIVPLAHPGLGITGVEIDVKAGAPDDAAGDDITAAAVTPEDLIRSCSRPHGSILITATVSCHGRTGVEMEALTGVLGAALTVYDMCKAVDKGMVVGEARVVRKRGGKSGGWEWGVKVDEGGVEGGKS
ncbi:hypothetical protein FQN55_002721 [Onygenales sp. PD_40]|nr:hypothetical protein FQN55_002721 [Onygenales sp. PD_40]